MYVIETAPQQRSQSVSYTNSNDDPSTMTLIRPDFIPISSPGFASKTDKRVLSQKCVFAVHCCPTTMMESPVRPFTCTFTNLHSISFELIL